MKKVRFSLSARRYIDGEAAYIRKRNPAAGRKFKARIVALARQLSQFPQSGFVIADFPIRGMHRIVTGDYVVDYQVHRDEVIIVSIRHGRQQEPDGAPNDEPDYEA